MPVAKGAGYVLASINQKKKQRQQQKESSAAAANALAGPEKEGETSTAELRRSRREERRKARGCRHCRRNHENIEEQMNCNWNVCVKCIGCQKILISSYFSSNTPPTRITVRSCCSDFRGRLSKVREWPTLCFISYHNS